MQSDHSVDQSFFHVFDITKIGGQFTEFRLVTFVKQKQWHFFMDAKQEILLKILQIAILSFLFLRVFKTKAHRNTDFS